MEIVGRDAELEVVESWLSAPSASALVIEGDAGIGKSTLWREALERAAGRGWRALTCSVVQSETQLSFTALRDLLQDAFGEIADRLPAPQRSALAVTLLLGEPRGSPPDPGSIAVSVLSALRALGNAGPTLVAIDDSHWLDAASAAPLEYALRRLDDGSVAILLARRTGHKTAGVLADVLDERVKTLRLEQLTVGALGRVLHDRLGVALPRPTLHRLHDASGGNPFFALELARSLQRSARAVRPGEPLPIPRTQRELVRERLETLPSETLDALSYASALSKPTIAIVSAALSQDARALLEPAAREDVAAADGEWIRFSHPLLAAAMYELVGSRHQDLHGRLSVVVSDPEERALHLALATPTPDESIASVLEDGAALAYARGSPARASALIGHARRLTEPADVQRARRRALAEVDYAFAAGDTVRPSELLDSLIAETEPGTNRARLLSRQARIRHFRADIASSVDLLYEALREAGDDNALRGEIEEGLAWGLLLVRRDLERAAEHARSAAGLARSGGATSAYPEALAALAITEFVLGRPWEATMSEALALEPSTLGLRVLRHPTFAHGYCLSCSDDLAGARRAFTELLRRADEMGDDGSVPSLLNHLALVECLAGRWNLALELADDGFERALEARQRPTQASILAKRGLIELRQGRLDAARTTALASLEVAGLGDASPEAAPARGGETSMWVLASVELADGNAEAAHATLGPMCDVLLRAGVREPGELRSLPDAIDALIALGAFEEAEAHVARLEGWAARLERPSAVASAARARGALHAARNETIEAIAHLEASVAAHESTALPYERGRGLLALGAEQRRARRRREARESLQSALATFEQLGAAHMMERTRDELGRVGGRAPSDGLTPTEKRVAALVAEGKSNKEVAAALVVSVHTVEAALTSIYRKLDVHSRTEMAAKLADRT